jgi:tetratricopeptide (TPR) repeat protein
LEEARATINAALQRKLADFGLYFMLASLDWDEGKEADMEKHLQSLGTSQAGEFASLAFRSGLAASRGEIRKSHELSHQVEDALDRMHLQGRADTEAGLAGADALLGYPSEAIAEAKEALRISHTWNVQFSAGVALAACRQEKPATDLANDIERTRPNDTVAQNVAVPAIRALVYLLPQDPRKASPEKAIDSLNTAVLYARDNSNLFFVRGLAYEEAKRYTEAQQDFRKILDMKSVHGPDMLVPIAQLELGRLYQKQGDTSKARIAYQNFLAAWKNADPDVPLLREAKGEYAKLQ